VDNEMDSKADFGRKEVTPPSFDGKICIPLNELRYFLFLSSDNCSSKTIAMFC
jgi:hypothetical protein